MLLLIFRYTATIVGNAQGQHVVLHLKRHKHLSALLGELYGICQKVAQHLLGIVWHEVTHHLLLLWGIHQGYLSGVCHIEMTLYDVCHEEHDVAMMPVGMSDIRLHLLYVEQLVDERQKARALS